MIISASRRTDIPAFYAEWFMNRIRAGFCIVPNPMNAKQTPVVSLRPEDVEAIVFWSKNPAPLLPYLDELDKRGFHYYFQFTLNDYPRALEPNVPSFNARLETFRELSERVGASRVVWRYDPIVISNFTNYDFHRERFACIAQEIAGMTQRVMISIVDFYKKTERHLALLEKEEGFIFQRDLTVLNDIDLLLKDLAGIAKENNIEIYTCAEEKDYSQVGVTPGRCIDSTIITRIMGRNILYKKDPYQRESCLCNVSKDIGLNNTCMHGCPYCYATMDYAMAQRKYKEHDPNSPALWGKTNYRIESTPAVNNQMKLL